MAIEGLLTGQSKGGGGGSGMVGFADRFRSFDEERKKYEANRKKTDAYRERFFKDLAFDTQERVLGGLKRRAEAGNQKALDEYNAVVGDERIGKQQMQYDTPQLSNLEKAATVGAAGVAGITELPRQAGSRAKNIVTNIASGKRTGPGADKLLEQQDTAKKNFPELYQGRATVLPEDGRTLLQMVGEGRSTDEIRTYLDEAKKRKIDADKRTLGATLEAGSLVAGGGSLTQASKLGTGAVIRTVAGTASSGAAGNVGNTLRNNPDASAKQLATDAAIGAGAGVVLGAGAAGAGKLYRDSKAGVSRAIPSISETRLGQKVAQTTTAKKIADLGDRFVAKVVDDTNYIKKPFKGKINEATGQKITDEIEGLVTNVRQFAGKAQQRLDNNASYQELSTLVTKKNYKELGDFIKAKQDAINNNKLIESGTRKGKLVEVPTGNADQEAAYTLLNRATKDEVQYLYDNGIITEQKYNQWINDPDYTRVQREIEGDLTSQFGSSGLSQSKTVAQQRLQGSKKKAIDPFASFEDWQRKITLEAEKNNLAKYLRDQSLAQGITKPIRVADKVIERMQLYGEAAQIRPVRNQLKKILQKQGKYVTTLQRELNSIKKEAYGEVEKKLGKATKDGLVPEGGATPQNIKGIIDEMMSTDMATLNRLNQKFLKKEPKLAKAMDEIMAIRGQYDEAQAEVADLVSRARKLSDLDPRGEDTLKVFENGVRELYTLDPRAAKQLSGAADVELKAVADWLLFPSRVLQGGATSMNAAFAVPNFIRDQMSSAILSKSALSTHNPIVFLQGLKEAILKPTGNAVLRKVPGISGDVFKPSELFEEYLSRNNNMTRVDLARNLKKATRQAQENLGVKGESVLRRYENIISASEKATRYQNFLGTYKKAIRNNVDPEQALVQANQQARTNSINFSNRGEIARFMKIFNPYFNAGVQSSATLARALKARPAGTIMKIGGTVLAPVAYSVYHNLSDPERAEIYARIPDYERRDNIIMVLGGDRGYIKVPLPPGIREFANPVRNYIESEYLGDRQSLLETAKNMFIDPFSPVGTSANELISQAVPQAVRPAIEIGMNRDLYTGKDIIPDRLEGLPAEEQSYNSTPQIYKDIGKVLGVSPLQVRKVVTGYGAGGVEGGLATADLARGANSGGRSTIEQIGRRFYGENPSDSSNAVVSKFYETYTPLKAKKENLSKKVTEAVKADDMATANKLANQINDEIEKEKNRLRETYGKFETDLTVLFDQFDSLKLPVEDGQLSKRSVTSRKK